MLRDFPAIYRKRAEYGFRECGFKHRAQWFFCPHRGPARELSEFLSAYYLRGKANSPSFSQSSPSLPQNSVRLSAFSSPKQYHWTENCYITSRYFSELNMFDVMKLFASIMVCEFTLGNVIQDSVCLVARPVLGTPRLHCINVLEINFWNCNIPCKPIPP